MRIFRSFALLSLLALSLSANAQSAGAPVPQSNRVVGTVDSNARVQLSGHVPAWAVSANDDGPVAGTTKIRLTFVLTRSPQMQAAFTQFLADQQDPASPSYHQWLTPQQVGEQFGPTPHDVSSLTDWLAAQGFSLVEVAASRVFVTVEAPAVTVTAALGTPFRMFRVSAQSRLSTTAEPFVPSALAPIVGSISGLAATPMLPQHHAEAVYPQGVTPASPAGTSQPNLTNGSAHFVTPKDFATIFDINAAYNAGYNGTGQKVAIIGRSRVVATDVTEYETNVGLPTNLPNVVIPTTGIDPGVTQNGDEGEALLDVDRVIGTAPNVQADLVVSLSTGNYDGIYIAAQYEVQTLLDPVMNISFGSCEVYQGASGVRLWDTLFSQAASEGISVFISSADSAAATCDTQFGVPPAYQFLSINYICSSSYATCVGGTEFADTANPSLYWSSTNSSGLFSALSYIPEGAWNDPVGTSNGATVYVAEGSGGGASIYVPKPSWQTGTGVPADGARDVPDMAFPASGHDGYYACYAGGGGDCANNRFEYFSGTSAAAPSMAGVTALLNQKAGGAQGNLNPLLYRLAATPGVFHDATPASSGVASCSVTIPSMCNNSVPSPTGLTGGLAGFALTTGYDQATGNGSLDVYNFLTAATATTAKAPTSLAVTDSVSSVNNNQSATFTATLTSTVAGTPTGTVQFYINTVASGSPIALSGGKAVITIPFTNAGTDLISAVYSGDTVYATTTAPGISFNVIGAGTSIAVNVNGGSIPSTVAFAVTATVTALSGNTTPTGLLRFYDNRTGYFASVPLVNGVATAPAQLFTPFGIHYISAYYFGDNVYQANSSVNNVLNVTSATPVITWPTPAPITYGTTLSGLQLDASTTVAGTFTYTPAAGAVLAAGNQTLSVTFLPTDTTDYSTATASVTLTVNKATPTIAWATPAPISYGTALSAIQLNATASVPGSFTYTPSLGFVPSVGTQTLSVLFTPTDTTDYTTATTTVSLTVNKPSVVITWNTPAAIPYGTALSATQLNATASVPGSFVYTPALGFVPSAGTQTLSVLFTPTDTINYAITTASVSLIVTKATPTATWSAPAPINYGTALSAAQLNATASVPGSFAYTPALGSVPSAGTQALSATFTPTDTTDYNTQTASTSLVVNKVPLAVTAAAATRAYGAANPTFTGTISGVVNADPITPSYTSTATSSSPVGTYPIAASLVDPNGRLANYNVTNTPSTLTVIKAASTTSLTVPTSAGTGTSVTLLATVTPATSGTPTGSVTIYLGSTAVGTVTLNASATASIAISTIPAGLNAITATYTGDTNFNGSFSAAAAIMIGTPDFAIGSAPTSASINAGQSATFVITVSPQFGYSQPLTFAVTGLPSNASAVFTPTTVTPNGSPVTSNLVISTDVSVGALAPPSGSPFRNRVSAAVTFSLAFLILPFLRRSNRRLPPLFLAVFALACLAAINGCSKSSTPAPKTPDGTYTLNVTATAGSTSHSTQVTLTVSN